MKKPPTLPMPMPARPTPEHKTAIARKQRAALKPHTESYVYNARSRNNLKRGVK